jgi:hypothetical protein
MQSRFRIKGKLKIMPSSTTPSVEACGLTKAAKAAEESGNFDQASAFIFRLQENSTKQTRSHLIRSKNQDWLKISTDTLFYLWEKPGSVGGCIRLWWCLKISGQGAVEMRQLTNSRNRGSN